MYLDPALFTLNADDLFLSSDDCNSSNAGCSEYIALVANTRTNIIPNGSFDDIKDNPAGFPDGWEDNTGAPSNGIEYDGDRIANGYPGWGGIGIGVDLQMNQILQFVVPAHALMIYTINYHHHRHQGHQ